jgi:predicted ABC-type ATPase
MKDIVVLGGPNGAGKTTAARTLIPKHDYCEFVNADEIARRVTATSAAVRGLAAGRLMITRIRELIEANNSFAFETTCAANPIFRCLSTVKHRAGA